MARVRFQAELVKRGPALCFDLPKEVSGKIGHTGRLPVTGTLNSYPISTSVFPSDEGGFFVMVGKDVQKFAGVKVGDTVRVTLDVDSASQAVEVPEDLAAALARSEAAKTAFDRLAPSHQSEYVEWIEEAKRPETRARRIEKTVERLCESLN